MKTIYNVVVKAMNGTVCLSENISSFLDKDLAEKVAEKCREVNGDLGDSGVTAWATVTTGEVFESEDEVPILQNDK